MSINEAEASPRMRPGDKLIRRQAVQAHLGGCAVSTLYADPEIMDLRVRLAPEGSELARSSVFWIEREVLELRDRRIAANAKPRAALQTA
jgi:hypothetical protein